MMPTGNRLTRSRALNRRAAQNKAAQNKAAQNKAARSKAARSKAARSKAARSKAVQNKNGRLVVSARVVAVAMGLAAVSAFAQQTGNPAVMAPDTPKSDVAQPPADHPNTADQIFARQMMLGGMAEVELGKLAGRRGQSRAVKDFANRMVEDHTRANSRLESLAKANRAQLPGSAAADPDAKAVRAQLEKLEGAEFDAAYMAAQVGDHQKTVQLLVHQIGAGQDAKMKQFAQESLPGVMRHLEMARQIQTDLAHGQAK